MKKKTLLLLTSVSVVSISAVAIGFSQVQKPASTKGDLSYSMALDASSEVTTEDEGYLHRVEIKKNQFDMVGYDDVAGNFGSIKKVTYGDYTFNGMIYNRSVINGFESLTVSFSDGELYYVFTDFLMEDMTFEGHDQLVSGSPVSAGGKAYFIVYNKSETPVTIEYLKVDYECNGNIDSEMIFNKSSTVGGARSLSKRSDFQDSFVELENDPTLYTNNYSSGKHAGHENNDSWYRWNGRYFANSGAISNSFSFGMTIAGNISQVVGAHAREQDNYFHYGVWPQFTFGSTDEEQKENAEYEMVYIGNDNYEPLGKDHALRPSDPYVNESYEGRFFTKYDVAQDATWYLWSESANDFYKVDGHYVTFASKQAARNYIKTLPSSQWDDLGAYTYDYVFYDPDNTNVLGSSLKLRDAYETYDLPFWFVRFDIYMKNNGNGEIVPFCDASINGFMIFSSEIFYKYDTVNNPDVMIRTLPLHVVNYGLDVDGNPASSYTGTFTYPRLINE